MHAAYKAAIRFILSHMARHDSAHIASTAGNHLAAIDLADAQEQIHTPVPASPSDVVPAISFASAGSTVVTSEKFTRGTAPNEKGK